MMTEDPPITEGDVFLAHELLAHYSGDALGLFSAAERPFLSGAEEHD